MNINLNPEEVALLQHLAALLNSVIERALRQALSPERYVQRELIKGNKFFMLKGQGNERVVSITWK